MADDEQDPSTLPLAAPPFRIPDEQTERRNTLRADWYRDRSAWGVDLLSLVPVEHQSTALMLWTKLETSNECHAQQLREAWSLSVDYAYQAGQQAAHGALQTLEDVGTGAVVDPSTPPTVTH